METLCSQYNVARKILHATYRALRSVERSYIAALHSGLEFSHGLQEFCTTASYPLRQQPRSLVALPDGQGCEFALGDGADGSAGR